MRPPQRSRRTEQRAASQDSLGARLRMFRQAGGWTVEALARTVGLTKGAISQIEGGSTDPSLSTIRRLAGVLKIPIPAFFETRLADSQRVVRRTERKVMRIPQNRLRYELLTPDLVGKRVEFLRVEYEPHPTERPEPYAHDGEEYGYVVQGRVEIKVADSHYRLKAGDSIFFPARLPHLVLNAGSRRAVMIWAISPPAW
jgi:transcriptional regulator with XRE-family HTH domain